MRQSLAWSAHWSGTEVPSTRRGVDDGSVTDLRPDHVKVHFRMDIDEQGWPSASVESTWAVDLGDGMVRLDNTPWFVRGVARGDIIAAQPDDDGLLGAGQVVQPSQNCTIRLIVLEDDGSAAARQSVLDVFHRLGTMEAFTGGRYSESFPSTG
jgi:hypothetical protein